MSQGKIFACISLSLNGKDDWKWKLVAQSCLTLCDSMDCSLPGSSVHRILQVRILEWVAMPSSGGSSQPRDQNQVSYIVDRFFYHLSYPGTWETGVYKIYSESEVKVKSLSCVWLFATPSLCSLPGSSAMGFSRQEYWSGLHFLLQGIFPTQGSNPGLPHCRQAAALLSGPPGKPTR